MKRISFETTIGASPSKVWEILWDHSSYRKWTAVFSPDSHYTSDMKEGSRISFHDGKGNGMYSEIARLAENREMAFRHIGVIKDGKELPLDEETKKWSGGMEIYKLAEVNGKTNLKVELDAAEPFEDFFSKTFPEALKIVKQLAEG